MKKFTGIFVLLVFNVFILRGQNYLMPDDTDASDPVSVSTCTGNFYDAGGDSAFYPNGQHSIMTICPDGSDPDLKTQVEFTVIHFSSDAGDYLNVYDGSDTSAPLLLTINSSQNNTTLTVTATGSNASGCLTFEFFSDSSSAWHGWEAEISCACQVDAILVSTDPAPNSEGVISVGAGDTVTFTGGNNFADPDADVTYTWDFGDGTTLTTSDPVVSHTYDDYGNYFVTLVVTNLNNNCSSTNIIGDGVNGQQVYVSLASDCEATVDAGADVTLDCDNPCTTLVASYNVDYILPRTDTSSYIITNDYCPPTPVPETATGINSDDDWTGIIDIGFTFSFFGNTYTQLLIGDNGVITFDLSGANGYCPWAFSQPIPDTGFPIKNAIFGAYHDLYTPAAPNPGEVISYYITGAAPYRKFVVNYDHVPHYSCNDIETTQQIILYETTNIIGVNITAKPVCSSWQGGVAVLGLLNSSGTVAYVPEPPTFPNRNTSAWTVTEDQPESWQFIPQDASGGITFEWLDEDGNVVGTDPDGLEVCPTQTTTYTAVVDCTTCGDEFVPLTDTVTVNVPEGFTSDIDPSVTLCESDITFPVTVQTYITSNPDNLSFSYEWYNTDDMSTVIGTGPSLNINTPGTYEVHITGSNQCEQILSYTLEILNSPQIAQQPPDLTLCDNYDDGDNANGIVQDFDLDSQSPLIVGTQTGVTVTYYQYLSQANAGDTSVALSSPYENQMPFQQEIFFRIEDDTTGCYSVGSFQLIVTPSVPYNQPPDMEVCDDDFDGIQSFDLDSQTPLMTTDPNVIVSYHISLADAENNVNPLSSPYTNTSNPQTIYVRLEDPGQGCIAYDQFELIVNLGPVMPVIPPFEQCDDDNDGYYTFDLSDMNAVIQNGQTGVTVLYYETEAEADAHLPGTELALSYTNTTAYNQTLWVVMQDNTTHCYSATGNFDLIVYDSPVVDWTIDALEVCDPDSDGFEIFDLSLADAQIAGSYGNSVTVTYYETEDDANLEQNAIEDANLGEPGWQYANIDSWQQQIYARVESLGTGCYDVVSLWLNVNPTPQINFTPEDMEVCDDMPSDGLVQVDLTQQEANILGDVDASLVAISYYHNEADAWNEEFAIANPQAYINSANPETIWVRVEYPDTNCASVVHFDLIVHAAPDIATPTPLERCDNDEDGEDNNGYVQDFMLTDKDAEILNGISPTAAEVTYYLTEADALSGTNALSSPFENTIPDVQTLWVRVMYLNTGCYSITTLDLVVNPLPTPIVPAPVESCDANADGFTDFELDAALITEIQNGESGVVITFHETYSDAVNNDNALSSPYSSISSGTQIIYARDTYEDTGCFRIVPVTLIANPSPQIDTPPDMEVCDAEPDAYDGYASFDLSVQTPLVLGEIDPATVTVTYHLNQADAETGNAPIDITQLFTNTVNPQTIWVRVEDNETGCYSLTNFQLSVNPAPETIVPTPLEVCDDDYDGIAQFDLESKVAEILNGQNASEWIVYFYETESQAAAGGMEDRLFSPYENISNPQTIWVRIESLNTGCYALTTLDLRVLPIPAVNYEPAPLTLCDNDLDGDDTNGLVQDFDLSEAVADILNGQTGTSLTFYDTLEGAQTADPAHEIDMTQPYANTVPGGESVWAVVTDNDSALLCSAIVELPLIVAPLPEVIPLTEYLFCEEDNDDVYYATLSEIDLYLLSNPEELSQMTITYYTSQSDAQAGLNPLPAQYLLNESSILWGRVEYSETGCYRVVGPIDININQAPEANTPDTWHLCDDATDGDDTNGLGVSFDLSTQDAYITGGAQDVTVSYYLSQTDALLDNDALSMPFINTENPQMIWARIENTETGCRSYVSFEIAVDDPPHYSMLSQVPLCVGEGPSVLSVEWEGDSTGASYAWYNAGGALVGTTQEIEVGEPGVYTVEVTTAEGCTVSAVTEVIQTQESTLTEEDLGIVDFTGDNSLTIPVSTIGQYGIGDYEYSLDGGPFTTQTVYTGLEGGEHTLIIRDNNGCADHILHFTIVDYMRFFTPNGDGNNDYWQLLGAEASPGAKIRIFDRYGKLLAELDPQGPGWDGTFNGYEMPSADYWFTIELSDGRIKKGHFSLVRR